MEKKSLFWVKKFDWIVALIACRQNSQKAKYFAILNIAKWGIPEKNIKNWTNMQSAIAMQ